MRQWQSGPRSRDTGALALGLGPCADRLAGLRFTYTSYNLLYIMCVQVTSIIIGSQYSDLHLTDRYYHSTRHHQMNAASLTSKYLT